MRLDFFSELHAQQTIFLSVLLQNAIKMVCSTEHTNFFLKFCNLFFKGLQWNKAEMSSPTGRSMETGFSGESGQDK